jgi:predicted nucleic acid-binding protein
MVLDTNILIYATGPDGPKLHRWLADPDATVSVISRIETLGFYKITPEEKSALTAMLATLPELALNETVATTAIMLRQQRKMALGDAVIAATALTHDLPLVTRNTQDFKHVAGLRLLDPFATAT